MEAAKRMTERERYCASFPEGVTHARPRAHKRAVACERCHKLATDYAPFEGKRYCADCIDLAQRAYWHERTCR